MGKFQCSQESQDKVQAFELADQAFKSAWEQFEQSVQQQLEYLDKLREDRNAKLDDARRALRSDAQTASIQDTKFIKLGPFSVQKKWSSFYIPERAVAILKDKGLYDTALTEKVVAEKVELAKYEEFKQFLERHNITKDFEECEDGQELTPAVSGPKPIPAFGAEQKESK